MGGSLAAGWLKARSIADLSLIAPRPSDEVRLWSRLAGVRLNPEPRAVDVLVVAVKPQVFAKVKDEIAPWVGPDTLVLSVMAGIRLAALEAALGSSRVYRGMPNTPGSVGAGVTLLCGPDHATDVETCTKLLQPLGHVEGPMSEDTLVKATALSGCGPAYAFLLAEAMTKAGVSAGLDEDLAARLSRRTIAGASALMSEDETPADQLRRNVTSPKGVTAAALDVLMGEPGLVSLMERAVAAAIARDEELSRDLA